MPKKTYVIRDTDGRYYRSFCDNFFTTAPCDILVTDTEDSLKARRFHSLIRATYRARSLSKKASNYYYVYEAIDKEVGQNLILRNKEVIERIRENDSETMIKVEKAIAEWKMKHGLN
ncbi:MAG: hypothetical protein IJ639_06165 [Ruminococcus sp.]|nr:hypothetical protein [Ruminococcus sp.]